MSILDEIIKHKHTEVAENKILRPVPHLELSKYFSATTRSIKAHLMREGSSGIIAEFKRKSPSRGVINGDCSVEQVTTGYSSAGASAISILTDTSFFGGANEDLTLARKSNDCPILRKDFVIDEYQIVEARSIGADAILLIAAALSAKRVKELCHFAHSLQLEVLVEVHSDLELKHNLQAGADMIGINNRNLKTFELNVDISRQLIGMIPESILKVSESGIESPEVIVELKRLGFNGFLIGQTFMQHKNPGEAAMNFIDSLKQLERNKK